ncbi:MAG TPA: thioesterase family protein [Myxococcota bacterium]|nr:thioesterase family protein [Myxococcota bacterium]
MAEAVTTFVCERRVAFSDTDSAGIVHFASFFRYMEDCEHAFVRSLGGSVHVDLPGGGFRGFPRVSASCDYLAPLRFEDVFTVTLTVEQRRRRSLVYGFTFTRGAEVVARGSTAVVCCARGAPGEPLRAVPLPDELAGVVGREGGG